MPPMPVPKPQQSTLDVLRESAYLKLLSYAANNINTAFTAAEAHRGAQISSEAFDSLKDVVLAQDVSGADSYGITVEALLKYVELLEFKEARDFAVEAKKEAANAHRIAIIAIAISAVLSLSQIAYQAYGSTTIDKQQISELVSVTTSPAQLKATLQSTDSPQLTKLQAQVDANHVALVQTLRELETAIRDPQKKRNTLANP